MKFSVTDSLMLVKFHLVDAQSVKNLQLIFNDSNIRNFQEIGVFCERRLFYTPPQTKISGMDEMSFTCADKITLSRFWSRLLLKVRLSIRYTSIV